MTTLPNLHDGFFDGVWLSADKCARFFVRTVAGERSTIILTDVEALNICGLRAGNIIFDLVLIAPEKLTVQDIEQAFDLTATHRTTEEFLRDLLELPDSPLSRHRALLAEFLEQCDLVKFADMSLTPQNMESLHQSACDFVRATATPEESAQTRTAGPSRDHQQAHDSLPST